MIEAEASGGADASRKNGDAPGVPIAALGATLAVVALAYVPALGGDWVWDDVLLIRDHPALADPAQAVAAAFGDFFGQRADLPDSGYLRPVPTLLNALSLAAFGLDPLPWHLTNLALHLAVITLLVRRLAALGLTPAAAALAGLVFGLHPVLVEPVAFISGRPDLLAGLGALLTLSAWLRARRTGAWGWGVATGAAFAFATASKEVALVLPVFLAALAWSGRSGERAGRRGALASTIPLLAVWIAVIAGRLMAGVQTGERLYFAAEDTPIAALSLVGHYAALLLAPFERRALYDHLPVAEVGPLAWLGALAVVAGVVLALRVRRWPTAGLAAAWVGLTLAPVLHLVPIPTLAAERYLYLPAMGVAALVAAGLAAGLAWRFDKGARAAGWAGAVVGALLVPAVATRASDWRDEISLWSAEVEHGDASYKAWQNLAVALAERGEMPLAAFAIVRAWERAGSDDRVWRNLVRMHLALSEKLGPGQGLTHEDRGAFLAVAMARPPNAAALRAWPDRLRAAGVPALADATEVAVLRFGPAQEF